MMHHASRVAATWSAMRRLEILSANLAIGTASVFVAFTAIASLAVDRQDAPLAREAGTGWALRGSLAPADRPVLLEARQIRVAPSPAGTTLEGPGREASPAGESPVDALPPLPKAV